MKEIKINFAEPDLGEEEKEAVEEVLDSNWIGGNGPKVRKFEEEICRITGAKYSIAVSNGTLALLCALQALREAKYPMRFVIPTLTFFATGAIAYEMSERGITLIDCERRTWNMKTNLENYKGIPIVIPVDVFGLPVDYDSIKKSGKILVADSAESFGSMYKGEPIGHQAEIHTFSFHSAKIITTGEGGAITTNNKELYEIMRSISNQGYGKKEWYEYKHERIGFNYRMPELQAAIGLVQIKKLPRYLKERNEKAKVYIDLLGEKVEYQIVPKWAKHNYFIFGILVKDNIGLCKYLAKEGIMSKTFWTPLHKQLPSTGSYPNAEYVANHGVMLPIHNKMSEEDAKFVAEKVLEFLREKK